MPSKVYNNVEGHRLIDNDRVAEDVTSVSLPSLSHPTSTIKAAGMAMDVDMPDVTHLEAAEFGVSHNNGTNCKHLADPGRHQLELRVVRQRYATARGEIEHESVKYRVIGVHKSTEKGSVETGNPLGSTEKYSILRYEEEINGEVTVLVDAMAGIIRYNGVDHTSVVESMLN